MKWLGWDLGEAEGAQNMHVAVRTGGSAYRAERALSTAIPSCTAIPHNFSPSTPG